MRIQRAATLRAQNGVDANVRRRRSNTPTFFDIGAYRALRTIAEGAVGSLFRNAPPVVRRVVEILNDQPGIELRLEEEPPIEESV